MFLGKTIFISCFDNDFNSSTSSGNTFFSLLSPTTNTLAHDRMRYGFFLTRLKMKLDDYIDMMTKEMQFSKKPEALSKL